MWKLLISDTQRLHGKHVKRKNLHFIRTSSQHIDNEAAIDKSATSQRRNPPSSHADD